MKLGICQLDILHYIIKFVNDSAVCLTIRIPACLNRLMDTAQTLCQLLLQRIYYRVAIKAQFVQLVCHHLHIVRMTMSNADYGMPAIKVKILLSLIVPNLASLSSVYGYVHQRIYVV